MRAETKVTVMKKDNLFVLSMEGQVSPPVIISALTEVLNKVITDATEHLLKEGICKTKQEAIDKIASHVLEVSKESESSKTFKPAKPVKKATKKVAKKAVKKTTKRK
jgi:hypothetical protein